VGRSRILGRSCSGGTGGGAGGQTSLPLVIDELQLVLGIGQQGLHTADLEPGEGGVVAATDRLLGGGHHILDTLRQIGGETGLGQQTLGLALQDYRLEEGGDRGASEKRGRCNGSSHSSGSSSSGTTENSIQEGIKGGSIGIGSGKGISGWTSRALGGKI